MNTKTFKAPTAKEALSRVSRELGPDAIIVDQRKIRDSDGRLMVEVVAAPRDASVFTPKAAPTFWQFMLKNKRLVLGGLAALIVLSIGAGILLRPQAVLSPSGNNNVKAAETDTPSPAVRAIKNLGPDFDMKDIDLSDRDALMDQIELLINDFDKPGAYNLARAAQRRFPDDPKLAKLWTEIVQPTTSTTEPAGTRVFRKRYLSPEDEWEYLGETPIANVEFPQGFSRVKFEKTGFETLTLFAGPGDLNNKEIRLNESGAPDADMVFVEGYNQPFQVRATKLEKNFGTVGDFLMDRCEVTNRQYYEFVRAEGYENPAYWKEPFTRNGREITRREAMALFVDSTGRPGPATWIAGNYPDGKGDHPVAGVSWYEAAAYAEFAGKELPTVFHWCYAATIYYAYIQYPFGNYESEGTVPVGTLPTVGQFGTYDLPGNVREWCYTTVGNGRCLLGGALAIIAVAVEPRFRNLIILSAGVDTFGLVRPEADNFNYVSRVKVPTLLIAGSTDPIVPMEERQIPTMKLLGAPPEHKKHVILEGGHSVYMLSAAKRECLDWLDKYLGPARRKK